MSRRLAVPLLALALPLTAMAATLDQSANKASSSISIEHDAIACIVVGKFTKVESRFDPAERVARARAYFRAEGTAFWYYVELKPEGGAFFGVLPQVKSTVKRIDYYLDVLDPSFGEGRTPEYVPEVVQEGTACSSMPAAGILPAEKIAVGSQPGAPPIPEGFEAAGIVGTSSVATSGGASETTGKGKSKGLILGAAGAAVAAGVTIAVSSGGGGSNNGSTSQTPSASILSVTPTGTALMAATILTLSAATAPSASQSYNWDFGDGASASGPVVTHVYKGEGTFNVVLRVSNGGASSETSAPVAVRSVAGRWKQTGANDAFTLTQVNSVVGGQDVVNDRSVHSVANGKVANPRSVSWDRLDNAGGGGVQDHVALVANDSITQLSGTFTHRDGSPENVTLVRQ